jgi:hypothetical protein
MLSFIMLMVTNNPFMLSDVLLNVILLSVTMLNVANNPFMLNVVTAAFSIQSYKKSGAY